MTIPEILASPYSSVAIAILTAIAVGSARRYRPEWWSRLSPRMQAVPALVVAAVFSSVALGSRAGFAALQGLGVELLPLVAKLGEETVLGWLGSMGTQQAAKRIPVVGSTPPDPPAGVVTRITIDPPLPSPRDSKASPMGPMGAAIVLLVALTGCAALRSANDFRNGLCDLIGDDQQAAIDAEAERVGMSPAEVLALWKASCLIRIEQAEQEAVGAIGGGP